MGNESPATSRRAQRGAGVLVAGVALLISGRRSVPAG